ncbi:4-hydroxybenzoate polyprenyltransferase [Talaromyces pinophilus]|nr:4-hydroxybenzoate polyprenyltransferase [Talaromyces pinophilus]
MSPNVITGSDHNVQPCFSKAYALGELIRVYRPIGVVIINFPYVHGVLFAASISTTAIHPHEIFFALLKVTWGTFWLRSWACAWNDMADRNLDRKVERCRNRPMARGAISYSTAFLFTSTLLTVWYISMNRICSSFRHYGPCLLLLSVLYPYTKRFTSYTPVFLGITFACGTLIGSATGEVDPLEVLKKEPSSKGWAILALFLYHVIWTTIFETVYAFQDIRDDTKAGINSMAVLYQKSIRPLLAMLGAVQVSLLVAIGILSSANLLYYLLAPFLNAALLIWMVGAVDFDKPEQCGWWFANGPLLAGLTTSGGLLVNYVVRS